MTTTAKDLVALEERLPASLAEMEFFYPRVRTLLRQELEEPELSVVELLLREMLNNAVCHGCHWDPRHHVRCAVDLRPDSACLVVENDGEGFDWRRALARAANPSAAPGHGLSILRHYASEMRYDPSGHRLTLIRELSRRERG